MSRKFLQIVVSRRVIYLYILLGLINSSYSLYGQELPTVIPPSPSMQQYMKYGDYQVSNFTGIPEIKIPIYTIDEGDIHLPINLTFHSSGFSPHAANGFVGLGWSLNYNGNISRTIKGKGDEEWSIPSPFLTSEELDRTEIYSRERLLNSWSKYMDTEPDVFSYNFNGHVGKFIIDPMTKKPFLLPYKPLSIIPEGDTHGFRQFHITDENSFKYDFVATELADVGRMATGYTMSKFTSAKDPLNYVDFAFQAGPIERVNKRVDIYTVDDELSDQSIFRSCWPGNGEQELREIVEYYYPSSGRDDSQITYSTNVPSKITFRSGVIVFIKDEATRMLKRIEIRNNESKLLKAIEFEFVSKPSFRKLLKKIKLYDENNQFMNQYSFNYFHELSGSLPDSELGGIDYWGYYNGGMPKDTGLMPIWTVYAAGSERSIGINSRQAVENYMKTFVLEKITYPTGGYTLFDFEANKYQGGQIRNYNGQDVGGLRIRKISNYAHPSAIPEIKTYKYAYSGCNECGWGLMDIIPGQRDDYTYSLRGVLPDFNTSYNSHWSTFRRRVFSSETNKDLSPHGSPVIYPVVTEYIGDGTQNIGKVVYHYDYEMPEYTYYKKNGTYQDVIYRPYMLPFQQWKNGTFGGKTYYKFSNGEYMPVKTEAFLYKDTIEGSIRGFHFDRYAFYISDGCSDGPSSSNPDGIIHDAVNRQIESLWNYGDYRIESGRRRLASKFEKFYDELGRPSIINEIFYDYTNNVHDQPTKLTKVTSKGDSTVTTYKYPHDFIGQQPYSDMVNVKHMWNSVLEESSFQSNKLLTATKTNYKNFGAGIFLPATVDTRDSDTSFETRIVFQGYDTRANLKSVSKNKGSSVCYIYSYNGVYPIAKIENGDYATVESLLGGLTTVNNFSNKPIPTDIEVRAFLLPLRVKLPNAFITTYTYAPLIGITSETDPKGNVTYYEYDNLQRLKSVKDQEGNVIKNHKYNYQSVAN